MTEIITDKDKLPNPENNPVLPKACEILAIQKHTPHEWTFRISFENTVKPGQFLELSIPKVGEAPISVSGMGDGYAELTIRNVGTVTEQLFDLEVGDYMYARGPYGNGWLINQYSGKHLVVIAGGTGVSPVRGLIEYAKENPNEFLSVNLILGFKNKDSILFRDNLNSWKKAEKFNSIYTLDNEDYEGFRKGMVTEFIPDIAFDEFGDDYAVVMVGPPIMIRFTALALLKEGVPEEKIWTSFERKMSCGIGKCGHCRINETYVCLDGPVFNYTKAKDLMD